MGTKKLRDRYRVETWEEVRKVDLSSLPQELSERYDSLLKKLLSVDPQNLAHRIQNHRLRNSLSDYLAAEIEWDSDPNAYRLIYKIVESKKLVIVVAFGRHDPAYEAATRRVRLKKGKS